MSYPVVCHIPAAAPAAVQLYGAAVLMGVADVDVVGPVYVC